MPSAFDHYLCHGSHWKLVEEVVEGYSFKCRIAAADDDVSVKGGVRAALVRSYK